MAIRLDKKEIRLTKGYATIRQLSPMDTIMLSKILKDKEDDTFYQNAVVAISIVEIIEPDYNHENYMILNPDKLKYDPKNPENYILNPEFAKYDVEHKERYIADPDNTDNYILNPDLPENYVLDPNNSNNYVLDKTKANIVKFNPVVNSEEEIQKRFLMPYSDWQIIAYHSLKMNEPNPDLLGE